MDSADPDDKLVISSLLISISCRNEYAHDVTERCSRLFHQRLKILMSNLFACEKRLNLPPGMPLPVLDLGELPLADLENQFYLRVASQFERHISAYLESVRPAITADHNTARNPIGSAQPSPPDDNSTTDTDAFQRFLHHGYWSRPDAWSGGVDNWLLNQCDIDPHPWRVLVARACLSPASRRRIWQNLRPASVARILEIAIPHSPDALLLGALQYFRRAIERGARIPQPVPPMQAIPIAGNEAQLTDLFSTAAPLPVVAWLHALRRDPPLRIWLEKLKATTPLAALDQMARMDVVPLHTANESELESGTPKPTTVANRVPDAERRLAPAPQSDLSTLSVSNAGLVLLWPLLPELFTRLNLWQKDHFIDSAAQINAACWLDATIWSDDCAREWRMPFTKWLCGLPLDAEIDWHPPGEQATAQLQIWLAALPMQIAGWGTLQTQDIQTLFLQRPGHLDRTGTATSLQVQRESFDILLNELPWPMDIVMLPWLEHPLPVRWLEP